MFAGLDGSSEMLRSETRGCGQENHIHAAIDHFLVSVQAHEARIVGDLDALPELVVARETLTTTLHAFLKGVAHGCQDHAFTG